MSSESNRTFFYPVKRDIVFRIFFADERNEEELLGFLKSILRLPDDEYDSIKITDPHLLPDYIDEKDTIIDVKLKTKSGKTIHIEMQIKVPATMRNRIIFYSSKLISEQIGCGDDYGEIKQAISIVITSGNLIPDSNDYYHRFVYYDSNSGTEFTDLTEIHTIELGKLPTEPDGTGRYDWAKFIDAETEEELDMIAERNPEIGKARVKLVKLSAEEEVRYRIEREERARRDFRMYMNDAKEEGFAEGKAEGMSLTNRLHEYLLAHDLMDELQKSVSDMDYQRQLIEKYRISAE
jgi:predicted transposase/invertase (TIGR01784 family)